MGMWSGKNPRRLIGGLLVGGLWWWGCARAQTAVVPLLSPSGLAFDAAGGVYVAETGRHVVDRFDPATGKFSVVAGNGTEGFSGDGGLATAAELDAPQGLALDGAGNLYIADSHNQRVRRVDAGTGVISTVAGSGVAGFGGDGGAAVAAKLSGPVAVALDGLGGLLVADAGNHRVRRVVLATGLISTYAGNGTEGDAGDGGAATAASLDSPGGLAVDGTTGDVSISDTRNHRVRRVAAGTGSISAVAGGVGMPKGISVDGAGNVYVADAAGQRVLRIASGVVTVVAGNGVEGFAGDGGQAVAALLDGPRVAGVSPAGLVTLADTRNQRVRQVDGSGVIRTLAGVGDALVSLSGPAVVQYGTGSLTVGSASGAVTMYEVTGGTPVALGTVAVSGGLGSFSTGGLAVGMHRLMAVSAGGESGVVSLTVTPAPVVAAVAGVTTVYGEGIPVLTGTLTGVLARDQGAVSVVFGTAATALSPVGSYPVTATLTGAAAGNYTVSAMGVVAIGQAGTVTSLASTAGSVLSGTAVGFTAKVASVTQGVPTGSVSFLDGGVSLGAVAVDAAGRAAMSSVLGVGTHTVNAVYAGDTNFVGSASAGIPEVVTPVPVVPADFALNATGGGTQTVVGGTSATFGFEVTVTNGSLGGPIVLAATGLPAGATASFNPALIPPGVAVNRFTLTVSTVKKAAVVSPVKVAVVLLGVAVWLGRRRRWVAVLGLGLLVGCGDRVASLATSSGSGPASYPITVTGTTTAATGAVLQHSVTVTLVVQ